MIRFRLRELLAAKERQEGRRIPMREVSEIDLNHKGVWGYHPLVITLANTKEVLRLENRAGNRPSHEEAAALLTPARHRTIPQRC